MSMYIRDTNRMYTYVPGTNRMSIYIVGTNCMSLHVLGTNLTHCRGTTGFHSGRPAPLWLVDFALVGMLHVLQWF